MPQIAVEMQVNKAKILKLIATNRLAAVNVNGPDDRPAWRISEASYLDFERRETEARLSRPDHRVARPSKARRFAE